MSQVSEIIKQEVEKKGRSTSAVAGKLKIPPQRLGHYIAGKYEPKQDFYDTWKRVYGEDLRQIIERNLSKMEEITPKQEPETFLSVINKLTDSTKILAESNKEISSGNNNLSEANLIQARNIERMVGLFEQLMSGRKVTLPSAELPSPNDPHTIPIQKKKQNH